LPASPPRSRGRRTSRTRCASGCAARASGDRRRARREAGCRDRGCAPIAQLDLAGRRSPPTPKRVVTPSRSRAAVQE
jgi:hypothetical protein